MTIAIAQIVQSYGARRGIRTILDSHSTQLGSCEMGNALPAIPVNGQDLRSLRRSLSRRNK